MAKIKPFYTPSANTELLKYYTKTPATPARDSLRETADLIRKNYLPQNTSSLSRSAYKAENINHSATPAATPYQAGYKAENINHSVVPASATPAVRSAVSSPRAATPAVRSTPSYTAASAVSPTTTSAMAPYTSAAATPTTTPTGTNPLTAYETEKQAEADRLAADKEAAEQAAWVSYQKLLKYMPTQNKANGLYGQGISESGALQAQSAYATRQGEIDTQYQDSMSDLEKYYTTKTETYLNQLYEQAKADIGNRPYATTEELQDFVRRNYGNLRDDQIASLMNLAKANDENVSGMRDETARNNIADSYVERIKQYIDDGDYENAAKTLAKAKDGGYVTAREFDYYNEMIPENATASDMDAVVSGEKELYYDGKSYRYVYDGEGPVESSGRYYASNAYVIPYEAARRKDIPKDANGDFIEGTVIQTSNSPTGYAAYINGKWQIVEDASAPVMRGK